MAVEFITSDQTVPYVVNPDDEVFVVDGVDLLSSGLAAFEFSDLAMGSVYLGIAGDIYANEDILSETITGTAEVNITVAATSTILTNGDGIVLVGDSNNQVIPLIFSNAGTITVEEAFLFAGYMGAVNFVNTGSILSYSQSSQALLESFSSDITDWNITNSGMMQTTGNQAVVEVFGATVDLFNSGDMLSGGVRAIWIRNAASTTTIENTGNIRGELDIAGAATIENSGDIFGFLDLANFNDTVINTGNIFGSIDFGGGTNALTNEGFISGTITGTVSVSSFVNRGTLGDDVNLGSGVGAGINEGEILGNLNLSNSSDTFINTGEVQGDINAGGGDDDITAGENADRINGDSGDDTLNGEGGDDELDGGANDDTLTGGEGFDTLTGGSGADSFVFTLANDGDLVTDFTQGEDLLVLSELLLSRDSVTLFLVGGAKDGSDSVLDHRANFGNASSSDITIAAQQVGNDTVLTVSSEAGLVGSEFKDLTFTITLDDIVASSMSIDDFLFV
ncbi:calcium-binding protein [Shimia ponticola]|uniref:calcium-binding protein n=1 Tax=Shimia ponticola TaxID=2582893 RepID=UPI0011BF970C|nr:calcium-binding protein [Shimia ponticola]